MAQQKKTKTSGKGEQKQSLLKTQEARILMYLVPVVIILAVIAYLFKQ